MYHKSIYNYIFEKSKNNWVFYNTLSGAIVILDEERKKEFDMLSNYNIKNNNSFVENLIKYGFLVENKYDEKKIVDASRARIAYGEKSAYLRILTTTMCNANCSYCYEKNFKPETMTIEVAKALVKYILKLPKLEKFYIHWFGGEPLLNIRVIDYVMKEIYEKLNENGTNIYVYFTSNGSMLNKNICNKAKKLWHANCFQITIDDIGQNYDNIKKYSNKKYNYNRIIENINYLLKEKIRVILRINYFPTEVNKVKNVISELSKIFGNNCKNGLLIFDPAPIFDIDNVGCSNCKKRYNMFEPAKFLVENKFLSIDDAFNLKNKSGQCYACHQGSFVVSPTGNLYKCTVTMNDKNAIVGNIFNGIDRNNYYFRWVNPNLKKKCNKCVFLPLCQGGCRAGELGYLNIFCKRNLSEIKEILNYKIDYSIKNNLKLLPLKKVINKDLYEMYQDIPYEEIGSINKMYGLSYEEFLIKCNEYVKDETIINSNINSTTKRFILCEKNKLIGEVGIRTTLNDFWLNKGSQVYYKIRKSEREKGYGNIILELALSEIKKLGYDKIRINCDDNNIASKKIILKVEENY